MVSDFGGGLDPLVRGSPKARPLPRGVSSLCLRNSDFLRLLRLADDSLACEWAAVGGTGERCPCPFEAGGAPEAAWSLEADGGGEGHGSSFVSRLRRRV